MKTKMIDAFCITTTAFGKQMFVMDSVPRDLDKKEVVELTKIKEKAKPFKTKAQAAAFIDNIHNPHERDFTIDDHRTPEKIFIPSSTQGELL